MLKLSIFFFQFLSFFSLSGLIADVFLFSVLLSEKMLCQTYLNDESYAFFSLPIKIFFGLNYFGRIYSDVWH
jgi:hypothetical protein